MKLTKLKIFHKIFQIKWVNSIESEELTYGLCNYNDAIITIVKNNPTEELNTLIHETIHAISFAMNLNLTETQVDSLANGISTILLDNKSIFIKIFSQYLLERKKTNGK